MNRQNLANSLNININEVKQVGSKQLFIVKGMELYSYYTKVGYLENGTWYLTTEKYSVTTSKQLNQFVSYVRKETLFSVEWKEI
jgi:hypothetical protein